MSEYEAEGRSLTVAEYLRTPESMHRSELLRGILVREAAPSWSHQDVVLRLAGLLKRHAARTRAGRVGISPIDVVLNVRGRIVVQPDLVFVSAGRSHIIRKQVWGAPDLAVEVLSSGSLRDRRTKLDLYREHGVREYWVVDGEGWTVTVHRLPDGGQTDYEMGMVVRSGILPRLRLPVARVFED